jgi:hypothetical protein
VGAVEALSMTEYARMSAASERPEAGGTGDIIVTGSSRPLQLGH